jgi:hypothetical protein
MKKILAIVLTGIAMLCAAALAEGTGDIANPWTEVADMAAFTEATGIELAVPENAENVVLRVMNPEDGAVIGEMEFTLDGMAYTARTAYSGVADSIEDISGMYYEWEYVEDTTVGSLDGMVAVIMQAADGDNTVEVVNWLDIAPGIVYSLSTVQPDVNGLDLTGIAEQIYIPMQGEA